MTRALVPTAVALAWVLMATPRGWAAGAGQDGCRTCGGAGVVECKPCKRQPCRSQSAVLFCSDAIACAACLGLREQDCKRCEGGEAELAARRAAAQEWLARARAIDAFMERELHHAESAHFRITYDLRAVDAEGGETYHGGMHLYLDRLEALYADFCRHLGAGDGDFFGKTHLMLWPRAHEQERASLRYTLQASSTESKLMGAEPVVSIFYDKSYLHEEFELHQAVVHQVAHCLLSNVFDGIWPGNIKGGWIDDGLAHWFETEYFGGVRHYCYVEADTLQSFEFGRWEPAVRAAVGNKEHVPFLRVVGRNTEELTPKEHMYAWSFCDFVLRAHPGKFGALARELKQKRPVAEALERVLGLSPFEFERAWIEFVMERYSLKAKGR